MYEPIADFLSNLCNLKSANKLKIFQPVRPPSCFDMRMFITHPYTMALVVEVLIIELCCYIFIKKALQYQQAEQLL